MGGPPRKLSQNPPALPPRKDTEPGRSPSTERGNRVGPLAARPAPPRATIRPEAPCAAPRGAERGGRRRARGGGGGSGRGPRGSRTATPRGQRAASPSMAGVPGAGPGSQLSPRRAKAKPFARGGNARRAPAAASLPGIRPRLRAALPPPPRVGAASRSRGAREVCGAQAGTLGRGGRAGAEALRPEARPAAGRSGAAQRSAAQLARGPGPAWRAGPRLLTLFLGDFGSRSPPRSDRRRLVMSPRPALEQSQGCWQAAALRRELGEARACCARRGR